MADSGEELGVGKVRKSTGKALYVDIEGYGSLWIPISALHDDSEVYGSGPDNSQGKVVVKAWFARKEGLV